MSILDNIAADTRSRVAAACAAVPLELLQQQCAALGPGAGTAFFTALQRPGLRFICEVKKASPSKGLIAPHFPFQQIAADYAAAGADCISCLTEPRWFLGSDEIFRKIRNLISTPMLRKDFTISEYQIYQARTMGANAVLLICSLLDFQTLRQYLALCEQLGLAVLVEAHTAAEIDAAVAAGAKIIGVNNRNLGDFSVDFSNAVQLRNRIPTGTLYVAESGVTGPDDIAVLKEIGADAVLIGETLMRAADKRAALRTLREAVQ